MAEPAADGEKRRVARRRTREAGGTRSNRFLVSYNDDELTIVRAAAEHDDTALAAWVSSAALAVAKETVVPVSADAKEVVQEVIRSRVQLSRIGNNLNQIARALNSDGTVTDDQLSAVLDAVAAAIKRQDSATLQLMRERQPRS